MKKIASDLTELIGQTPLLSLNRLLAAHELSGTLTAKLEYFNPLSSIKDRIALAMINDAKNKKILTHESTIVEATSGNTGIGLAFVCSVYGYHLTLVMPNTMSRERILLLEALGANVVLTEGALGMSGAIKKAEQIKQETPQAISLQQFENPENPNVHYLTTGPEIYEDTNKEVDVLIAGVGTGGTITGTGRYLKQQKQTVQVIAVEPSGSPVLTHHHAGSHQIQGIGAGFVPEVLDLSLLDEVILVSDEEAKQTSQELAKYEGLIVGISSGAAVCAALKLLKRNTYEDKHLVVILPDSGERYFSTHLYET